MLLCWVSTDDFKVANKLNRHGIVHGIFTSQEYRDPANSFKLVSVLDLLAFVHTLGHPGVNVNLRREV